MIPEPQPYDPDDPTYDENAAELAYLLPDRGFPRELIDRDDPLGY